MTTSAVRLVGIAPDDAAFAQWCDVWAAAELFDRPDETPRPEREHVVLGRELVGPGGSRDGTHRAALLGNDVVGALRLILPLRDNTTVAFVDVAVRPEHRRWGIGRALLAEALRLAADAGHTELISEVDEPVPSTAGRAFALRHGWTRDLLETRRDLALPPDEAQLSAVEADARQASAGYELITWRDRTPDGLLEDRALLEQRMSTDAPHGDLPVEEERWDGPRVREIETMNTARGRTALSAGAVRDGRLVAFTDLHVSVDRPEQARQGSTLVLREHRGHRLGALVKAATLRELGRAFPGTRRVTTYNAEDNAPMVAVNRALGFEPAGHLSMWTFRVVPGGRPG